jgi:hypothetical protein
MSSAKAASVFSPPESCSISLHTPTIITLYKLMVSKVGMDAAVSVATLIVSRVRMDSAVSVATRCTGCLQYREGYMASLPAMC